MKKIFVCIMLTISVGLISCKKFLDAKSDSMLATLNSFDDVQSLMDNFYNVNTNAVNCVENSSDDFFLNKAVYDSFSFAPYLQRQYTWQNSNIFAVPPAGGGNDWSSMYGHIYRANTALEKVEPIAAAGVEVARKNDIKGQSYFLRGYCYLQMILAWGKGYNQATAANDLGLPLRLTTDFNVHVDRNSVAGSYAQIISDLKTAVSMLPIKPSTVRATRPGKAAAYAALARTYLSMRDYTNCLHYADSCLMVKSDLVDYNTLDPNSPAPFQQFGVTEVVYEQVSLPEFAYFGSVDPVLYSSYDDHDLRKSVFFTPAQDGVRFKGSYFPGGLFSGIALDEVYLMRAESYARTGNVTLAMADLNKLMKNRMAAGFFTELTANNTGNALDMILKERRKELISRQLRWMDLKRLNLEGANITLTRTMNGQTYTLAPNSPRYAMPIPDDIISLAGIAQNPY